MYNASAKNETPNSPSALSCWLRVVRGLGRSPGDKERPPCGAGPAGPHLQLGRLRLQCGVMLLQEGALLLQRQDLAAEGRVLGLQVLQLFLE